ELHPPAMRAVMHVSIAGVESRPPEQVLVPLRWKADGASSAIPYLARTGQNLNDAKVWSSTGDADDIAYAQFSSRPPLAPETSPNSSRSSSVRERNECGVAQ
ncbi:MAG TPA: hypothetical protein VKP14_06790, partial [Gaiellaceae bacterium]|nr:hypothetical protein [Gaiellaceae bacterium]